MSSYTEDVISNVLTIRQAKHGYRFGIDALLLATDLPAFESIGQHVVELGAAHGPVCLSIAHRMRRVEVTGVELQESLFALLRHNATTQDFGESLVTCILGDVRQIGHSLPSHSAALVVFNPPYFPLGSRRIAPDSERAIARHEVHGALDHFVKAAQFVLHPKGWCKLILPPWRLPQLMLILQSTDFGLASLRFVHANEQQDAYLCEIVLRRGGKMDLCVKPALLIRDASGYYTKEVASRVAGAADLSPSLSFVERVHQRSLNHS